MVRTRASSYEPEPVPEEPKLEEPQLQASQPAEIGRALDALLRQQPQLGPRKRDEAAPAPDLLSKASALLAHETAICEAQLKRAQLLRPADEPESSGGTGGGDDAAELAKQLERAAAKCAAAAQQAAAAQAAVAAAPPPALAAAKLTAHRVSILAQKAQIERHALQLRLQRLRRSGSGTAAAATAALPERQEGQQEGKDWAALPGWQRDPRQLEQHLVALRAASARLATTAQQVSSMWQSAQAEVVRAARLLRSQLKLSKATAAERAEAQRVLDQWRTLVALLLEAAEAALKLHKRRADGGDSAAAAAVPGGVGGTEQDAAAAAAAALAKWFPQEREQGGKKGKKRRQPDEQEGPAPAAAAEPAALRARLQELQQQQRQQQQAIQLAMQQQQARKQQARQQQLQEQQRRHATQPAPQPAAGANAVWQRQPWAPQPSQQPVLLLLPPMQRQLERQWQQLFQLATQEAQQRQQQQQAEQGRKRLEEVARAMQRQWVPASSERSHLPPQPATVEVHPPPAAAAGQEGDSGGGDAAQQLGDILQPMRRQLEALLAGSVSLDPGMQQQLEGLLQQASALQELEAGALRQQEQAAGGAAAAAAAAGPSCPPDEAAAIPSSNKGFQLLLKAGWSQGSGLGARRQGRVEPVNPAGAAARPASGKRRVAPGLGLHQTDAGEAQELEQVAEAPLQLLLQQRKRAKKQTRQQRRAAAAAALAAAQ